MKLRSVVLTGISLIILAVVIALSDLSQLPVYLSQQGSQIFIIGAIFLLIFLLRILRNFFLLRFNQFTNLSLFQFLPDGLISGVIATYGPLKSGELLTMEIYQERLNIDRGQTLSVIISGRMIDVFIVLIYVAVGIIFLSTSLIQSLISYLVILTIILTGAFTILLSEQLGLFVLAKIRPLFIWKLAGLYDFFLDIATSYYQHLEHIKSLRSVLILILASMSRWAMEIVFYGKFFSTFNFGLTVIQTIPVIGLSYAIGVSSGTPGGLGTSQLTALGILSYYGIAIDTAALSLIILTGISLLMNSLIMGMGLLLRPLVAIEDN